MKNNLSTLFAISSLCSAISYSVQADTESPSVISFDTGHTITKVRTAQGKNGEYLVASTYEGKLLAFDYSGTKLWQHELAQSNVMNRDIWAGDITGDGYDEVFAASANGTLYALSDKGETLWTFKQNDAPLNAVATVKKSGTPYVVVGGYDKNLYYLNANGELEKTIASSTYSIDKSWGKGIVPPKFLHITNFIRPVKIDENNDNLVIHGVLNSNSGTGTVYEFEALADLPYRKTSVVGKGDVKGDLRVVDKNNDGVEEFILGPSSMIQNAKLTFAEAGSDDATELTQKVYDINTIAKRIDRFGYRVGQVEVINNGSDYSYLALFGSKILVIPSDLNYDNTEILSNPYSYNDMWKSNNHNKLILASAQSGGSAIHVLDLSSDSWKSGYENIQPPGKIASILSGTQKVKSDLAKFTKPSWQPEQRKVYMMTEDRKGVESIIENYNKANKSPVFLANIHNPKVENFDRSNFENEVMRDKRDKRKQYTLTQKQALDKMVPEFEGQPGIATWGGHGNDPYMFSLSTKKKMIDAANGKKMMWIFPELEGHDEDYAWMVQDQIIPLAKYSKERNANIFVRTKHTFWQAIAHMPMWEELMSGEYANVFVPSMEETTDKSMELSLAARAGTWLSGSTSYWGDRVARDNPSFDRTRQHSHQMLPNGYLRKMIYSISNGARYINNFPVDQQYMSLLWELIAKGALFVPERDELLHISPVHLSMTEPDEHFLNEGNNAKWLTFYDEQVENDNKMVFSRLNGTWPGAVNTEWDFSRYAAGVNDRRLNFLPPYSNGLVLLTPIQEGICEVSDPRGKMVDKLHPIYKDIMQEYVSDGYHYYSNDLTKKYKAEEYYKVIEASIKDKSKNLPITVEGEVSWTLAQVDETHLRLTLIDGGFINPSDKVATVKLQSDKIKSLKDILDGEVFTSAEDSTVTVNIPTGMFRFIDIELSQPL